MEQPSLEPLTANLNLPYISGFRIDTSIQNVVVSWIEVASQIKAALYSVLIEER